MMNDKPYQIHTIDLHFQQVPQTIAAYLVHGPDGYVLIETGPGSTLPTLLAQLAKLGVSADMIPTVLVTHIHFDHAGAAGWWAQQGAQVHVHSFGAHHLIYPDKLIASATRIYGAEMETLWGEILAAPQENVNALADGDLVQAAGLTFKAVETPGHARHHHVFELDDIAFTGDAAGIFLPQSKLVDLPTPPPEFDRETWQLTLKRLAARHYRTIYPTHFGPCTAVSNQLQTAAQLLEEFTTYIDNQMQAGVNRDQLVSHFTSWNHQRGRDAGLDELTLVKHDLVNPPFMTVDGIMRYWRKRRT